MDIESWVALDPDEWIRENWSGVWAFAYSLCANPDTANELAQDTFVRAYQRRSQLKDETRLRPWLMSITKNLWRDDQKSAWRRRVVLVDDWHAMPTPTRNPEDEALKRIESDGLWRAILSLRTADRAVLILRAREALEFRDIARILRIREGTARSRYRRAHYLWQTGLVFNPAIVKVKLLVSNGQTVVVPVRNGAFGYAPPLQTGGQAELVVRSITAYDAAGRVIPSMKK